MSIVREAEQGPLTSRFWRAMDEVVLPQVKHLYPTTGRVPIFGDPDWNMACFISIPNLKPGQKVARFSAIKSDFFKLTAKELAADRLNRPIAALNAKNKVMAPQSLPNFVKNFNVIVRFVHSRGKSRFSDLNQTDLDEFVHFQKFKGSGSSTIEKYVTVFRWLYYAKDRLSHDELTFLPWGGRSASKVAGTKKQSENLTDRLSEDMMRFLVQWAILYVERFGSDVIAAYSTYIDGLKQTPRLAGRMKADEVDAALHDYFEGLAKEGKKLPGHNNAKGEVNIHRIVLSTGISTYAAYSRRDIIERYADEIGTDGGFFDTPVTVVPEAGIPWREPFDESAILAETGYLMIACYIVCGFLSGMRDSELQGVERGGLEVERDEFGEIVRYRLHSIEHKGKKTPIRRSWVVIEPVATAVATLERLLDVLEQRSERPKSPYLFQQARRMGTSLGQTVNQALARFIQHADSYLQPRLSALRVPRIKKSEEKVTTRKLRRTTSWFIADRPFGTLAGMIQFGQAMETTFEGYAGSSPSGFRAEVERERLLARRKDMVEMYEDHKRGIRVAGPMSEMLADEFDAISAKLDEFPGKVVDEKRLMKMLEHLRVRLYPGILADCFFEAADAECLKGITIEERTEPIVGVCDPKCNNACWRKSHLENWRREHKRVKAMGKRNRISPMQRKIIRRKQTEYETIIGEIEGEPPLDCRRPFGLNYAAMGVSSSMA